MHFSVAGLFTLGMFERVVDAVAIVGAPAAPAPVITVVTTVIAVAVVVKEKERVALMREKKNRISSSHYGTGRTL